MLIGMCFDMFFTVLVILVSDFCSVCLFLHLLANLFWRFRVHWAQDRHITLTDWVVMSQITLMHGKIVHIPLWKKMTPWLMSLLTFHCKIKWHYEIYNITIRGICAGGNFPISITSFFYGGLMTEFDGKMAVDVLQFTVRGQNCTQKSRLSPQIWMDNPQPQSSC